MNETTIYYPQRTAIKRGKPSKPLIKLLNLELHNSDSYFLDFGCGKMDDVNYLQKNNYNIDYLDINIYEVKPCYKDFIICNYVLCVVPFDERLKILYEIKSLLKFNNPEFKTRFLFSVRSQKDIDKNKTKKWLKYNDGYLTSRKTFQKGFTNDELKRFLNEHGFKINHDLSDYNSQILVCEI